MHKNQGPTTSFQSRMMRVGGLSIDGNHRQDLGMALNGGLPVRRSFTSQSMSSNGVLGLNGSAEPKSVLPYRLIQQFNQPRRARSCRTSMCSEISRSCSPGSASFSYSTRSGSSGSSSRTVMSPRPYESSLPPPRRVFPQRASQPRYTREDTDSSSVVFDAELSFGIGSPPNGRTRNKTRVNQHVQPTAAHLEPSTTSAYISRRVADFLQRTDHIMEEWKRLGRKDPDEDMRAMMGNGGNTLARSRSAANIMTRAMRYFSRASSVANSTSAAYTLPPDDMSFSENDELSGLTVDLADEHSAATLASERLQVEVADRLRLEKELGQVQDQNKRLQQSAERLELELLHSRTADLNGLNSEGEDSAEDGTGDANAALRARYERTVRELDFTKRRLQQQHEDDLEQLVALKKQLEKKLADAYEEVEEQRQVVGQWKRKVQKLSAEMSDLRLLVETQSSRNNFLEKKQRKFDSELQLLQDELRQEKQHRERIQREKDLVLGEKYSLEQTLSSVRLELESREERVAALTRELEELTFGGKTEEDVAAVKKARHQLEQRVKEQEEELDDMAAQLQLLEQAKLRLEMSLEQMRKENRREIAQRDDELEDARSQAYKKVKALESQLESEHEERTQLVREKHELERRLNAVEEEARVRAQQEDGLVQRLRRDLRRTRALLNDAHSQMERLKADTPTKAALRTLRNQLEDLEFARAQAVKARQTAESELADVQAVLDEAQRAKQDCEERCNLLNRECSELRTQLEENEEELAEVLKKYRAAVHQMSSDQIALRDSVARVGELETERNTLSEQLADLTARLANIETMGDPSSSVAAKRLELRTKELESRLELEQTTRGRMEVQISRLKENVDKLQSEISQSRAREQVAQDAARKAQRTLRELREECASSVTRENEATERRKCLEKKLEVAEAEAVTAKTDLKVALQRIEDLQQAIQGDLELESSGSDNSDNENDSDDSDESIETFLAHHNMASSSNRLSGSFTSKRSSLSDRSPRSEHADSSPSGPMS